MGLEQNPPHYLKNAIRPRPYGLQIVSSHTCWQFLYWHKPITTLRNPCLIFCFVLLVAGAVVTTLRPRFAERKLAEESKPVAQATEESEFSPAQAKEMQKRRPEGTVEISGLSEMATRTEKAIAVDIIHLFGKNGHPEKAERIQRVRMSELIEEIYLSYRRRTTGGLPLPNAAVLRDLSPDDKELLETLASVGKSDPQILYKLERKIEDYGLKMGCESVEQVFAIWLSGN